MKYKRIVTLPCDNEPILQLSNQRGYHETVETSNEIVTVLKQHGELRKECSPLVMVRSQVQGPRTDGNTVCPLFLARFNTNTIRQGDMIIAYQSDGKHLYDIQVFYYVGKGLYSYIDHHYKNQLFDYSSIKGAFGNYIRAKINHLSGIDFSTSFWKEFKNRYLTTTIADKGLENPILQLHNRKERKDYPYLGTQPVNDMYVKQLFLLYVFGRKEYSDPSVLLSSINKRTQRLDNSEYEIHINRNSKSIYRDSNFSFGLVDKESPNKVDILIFCFTIDKDGVVDIVQIGSNNHYYQGKTNHYIPDQCFLSKQFIIRAKEQGFKKIRVMRGDKIGAYRFPQKYSLHDGFDLTAHQEQLMLIYNVTPIRKRGRKKPSGAEAEWYSAIKELI